MMLAGSINKDTIKVTRKKEANWERGRRETPLRFVRLWHEGANYLEELSQFERIEPGIKRGLMRVFMELPSHTKKSLGMNITLFYLIEGNNTFKVLNSCVNSRRTETHTTRMNAQS
jgi:hypothetical protein